MVLLATLISVIKLSLSPLVAVIHWEKMAYACLTMYEQCLNLP